MIINPSDRQIEQSSFCSRTTDKLRNIKTNKLIEGGLTLSLIGSSIACIKTQEPKSILAMSGKQILAGIGKNWLKKLDVPRVVSYPVLVGLGVGSYCAGATAVSDTCFGIAAKHLKKDAKNYIKGKSFVEIASQGIPENIQRAKDLMAYFRGTEQEDSVPLEELDKKPEETSEDESIQLENGPTGTVEEISNPSLWARAMEHAGSAKKAALVGSITFAGAACNAAGLSYTGMELLTIASKMGTVILRDQPIVAAGAVATEVAGIGFGFGNGIVGAAEAMVDPSISFGIDVVADTIKAPMKGKRLDRPWFCPNPPTEQSEEASDSDDGSDVDPEKNLPSVKVRAGVLALNGAAAFVSNQIQPEGGMIPHKVTSLFVNLADTSFIKGHSSQKELGYRLASYGGALAIAAGADQLIGFEKISCAKIVGSTVLKLVSTKEVKNISNLDFSCSSEQSEPVIKDDKLQELLITA